MCPSCGHRTLLGSIDISIVTGGQLWSEREWCTRCGYASESTTLHPTPTFEVSRTAVEPWDVPP